jgi:2-polyprenyl-3-methyl-5-hydroxy-6-metoxy-1,4-benzoquinol methylase
MLPESHVVDESTSPPTVSAAVYDQRYQGDYRQDLGGYEFARWEALEHFLGKCLQLGAAARILDYGAGSGLHVELWEKAFPHGTLYFCDISSVAKRKFSAKYPRHAERYFLIGDPAADRGGLFDVIVSVEVMEHVDDLHQYLTDVYSLLKPGGYFVWTTPCGNVGSIEQIYCRLTGAIDATPEGYRRWSWEDPTHVRRLKSAEIQSVLMQQGFSDVVFRFRSHLFSFLCTYLPSMWFTGLRNSMMKLDYRLFRRLPNGASMIGAARRRC